MKKIHVIVILPILLILAGIGLAFYLWCIDFKNTSDEAYSKLHLANFICQYYADHKGDLPKSWDDLAEYYADSDYFTLDMAVSILDVDWALSEEDILKGEAPKYIQAIGEDLSTLYDPNEMVREYLQDYRDEQLVNATPPE